MAIPRRIPACVACALPLLAAAQPSPEPIHDALAERSARLAERLSRGDLTLARVQRDDAFPERTHRRYQQRVSGVRVFGAQLVEQLDAQGRTLTIFGDFIDQGAVSDATPSIDASRAAETASTVFSAGGRASGDPELVWLPLPGSLRLAWMAYVRCEVALERVFVDARSGAILDRYSDLRTDATVGLGRGVWGDRKKLAVESQPGTFRAQDGLRPPRITTYDLHGSLAALDSVSRTGILPASYIAFDADNDWADGTVVDAHVYAGLTYDYYFKRHARHGLDNRDRPILNVAHPLPLSYSYANAFWDPFVMAMFYGDGDGRMSAFSGALDVVAHELTHGVTQFTWDGIYRNESGALNEAFSDIMGTGVEFMFQPVGNGRMMADYYGGEDLSYAFNPAQNAIRSLENPGIFCYRDYGCDPDHYSKLYRGPLDNGGVHHNSGIANQAFYLLAEGGVNRTSGLRVSGLGQGGREKAERIFYRGFTAYLTPSATFHNARLATIQAARDLYSEAEATQVAATWTAVGVE